MEKFDQNFNILPNELRFDVDLISHIYGFYISRGLHELALSYMKQAEQFIKNNNIDVPKHIINLFNSLMDDEEHFKKIELSMINLRSIPPHKVPEVIPSIINGKRNINEFILNEFVQAANIMLEKISSIADVKYENKYNDLLVAILKLRLPIWGWEITDQPRGGLSNTGKGAGSIDIEIRAGAVLVTLAEALHASGKNYCQEHALRCFKYNNNINSYYIIIYCKGELDESWKKYQQYITSAPFEPKVAIRRKADGKLYDFIDLTSEFKNTRQIKLGNTLHESEVEMFHIMINLYVN